METSPLSTLPMELRQYIYDIHLSNTLISARATLPNLHRPKYLGLWASSPPIRDLLRPPLLLTCKAMYVEAESMHKEVLSKFLDIVGQERRHLGLVLKMGLMDCLDLPWFDGVDYAGNRMMREGCGERIEALKLLEERIGMRAGREIGDSESAGGEMLQSSMSEREREMLAGLVT